jgi:hypothetical protein
MSCTVPYLKGELLRELICSITKPPFVFLHEPGYKIARIEVLCFSANNVIDFRRFWIIVSWSFRHFVAARFVCVRWLIHPSARDKVIQTCFRIMSKWTHAFGDIIDYFIPFVGLTFIKFVHSDEVVTFYIPVVVPGFSIEDILIRKTLFNSIDTDSRWSSCIAMFVFIFKATENAMYLHWYKPRKKLIWIKTSSKRNFKQE